MNTLSAVAVESSRPENNAVATDPPAYANSKAVGLENIVAGVVAKARAAASLAELRTLLLTLDGNQDERALYCSLLPHQAYLLDQAGDLPVSHRDAPLAEHDWVLGLWQHACLYIAPALPDDGNCHVVGVVRLPAELAGAVAALRETARVGQTARMREVDDLISGCGVAHVLETIRFALCYSEPSVFYVNEETFSNFGPINNLHTVDGSEPPGLLFVDLLHRPLAEWTENQKTLVYCLYLVRRAGGRCEEFSGKQTNLTTLARWLEERYDNFTARLSVPPTAKSPWAMADHLFALRQALKKEYFFYRQVNGIDFNKTENLGRRSDICLSVHKVPRALREYLEAQYGVRAERQASIDVYMRGVVERIAALPTPAGQDAAIEGFLELLIRTSTDELASDYGMSRTPRDFHGWSRALKERRYDDICNWIPDDFRTAVYAGRLLDERVGGDMKTLYKVLYSVAGRMTYNSWHYAAGQCPIEFVPPERHFLFPPRLSDIVIVSHQHHAGHRVAEVNMALRSPAGIFINGKKYYGMVDLRYVRSAGTPYTYAELVRAREYTGYARAFYQALADICVETDTAIPIRGYSKEWYARKYLAK